MTTVRKVQQAPSPQQALLVLADALDRIEAKLDQQAVTPADAWGQWDVAQPVRLTPDEAEIETLKLAISVCDDGEERRALEAKLRLLQDDGAAIVQQESGVRVQSIDGGDTVTVDIPPASKERQEARARFVHNGDLHSFLSKPVLTEAEFENAYVKGGPMWLYLGDRDAIMAMPRPYREVMIADIEKDSPEQAKEVARDLLMDRGVEGTTAVERLYGE